MSDRIVVKNFNVLKNIDIEIKNINVVIGDQAQGKSLLSKLIYYFSNIKEYLTYYFLRNENVSNLNEEKLISFIEDYLVEKFDSFFPRYLLKSDKNFVIKYYYSESKNPLRIIQKEDGNIEIDLPVTFIKAIKDIHKILNNNIYSDNLDAGYQDIINSMKWGLDEQKNRIRSIKIDEELNKIGLKQSVTLIPSGRSFFSYLEDNFFFLSDKMNIEEVIKNFGRDWQSSKQSHIFYRKLVDKNNLKKERKIKASKSLELAKNILKGELYIDNSITYIKSLNDKDVKLQNASSGQQEVLPIILLLINLYFGIDKSSFIIEEPEAHLYPSTQKSVIDLLMYLYNLSDKNTTLFMTTHSPYILTSLNNLIQANNTFLEKPEKEKQISKIVDKDMWVDFNNVSAFYLNNGACKSILNIEDKLIDAKFIDEISQSINSQFQELINIQYDL